MRKKIYSLLLSLIMVVTFMPAMTFADVVATPTEGVNVVLTASPRVNNGDATNLSNWQGAISSKVSFDTMLFAGNFIKSSNWGGSPANNNKGLQSILDANSTNGIKNAIFTCGQEDYAIDPSLSMMGYPVSATLSGPLSAMPGFTRIGEAYSTDAYKVFCLGAASDTPEFPQEDIDALDTYLNKNSNTPVFVLSYYSLGTINGKSCALNAEKLIDVLNKYNNVVFFWGDRNCNATEGKIVKPNGSITYDNNLLKKIKFTSAFIGNSKNNRSGSYGLVANINGKTVALQYYKSDGTAEGEAVVIDLNDSNNVQIPETQISTGDAYVVPGAGRPTMVDPNNMDYMSMYAQTSGATSVFAADRKLQVKVGQNLKLDVFNTTSETKNYTVHCSKTGYVDVNEESLTISGTSKETLSITGTKTGSELLVIESDSDNKSFVEIEILDSKGNEPDATSINVTPVKPYNLGTEERPNKIESHEQTYMCAVDREYELDITNIYGENKEFTVSADATTGINFTEGLDNDKKILVGQYKTETVKFIATKSGNADIKITSGTEATDCNAVVHLTAVRPDRDVFATIMDMSMMGMSSAPIERTIYIDDFGEDEDKTINLNLSYYDMMSWFGPSESTGNKQFKVQIDNGGGAIGCDDLGNEIELPSDGSIETIKVNINKLGTATISFTATAQSVNWETFEDTTVDVSSTVKIYVKNRPVASEESGEIGISDVLPLLIPLSALPVASAAVISQLFKIDDVINSGSETTAETPAEPEKTEPVKKEIVSIEGNATADVAKSAVYTGKKINQPVTVSCGDKVLTEGVDYETVYLNNKNIGRAQIIISGIGEYKGCIVAEFNILPRKMEISKLKAGKKAFTLNWKTDKTVGAYQIKYSASKNFANAKTVTVTNVNSKTKTIKKLKSGRKYYVKMRSFKSVDGTKYYSNWTAAKSVKVK